MMIVKRENKKTQDKPAVALIAPLFYASVVQSVVNTAKYFAMQGYLIDVFIIQDEKFPLKTFKQDNIQVYYVPENSFLVKAFPIKFIEFFEPILKSVEDAFRFLNPPHSYSFIIGFDPDGLIKAGILSLVWRVPYIYHSLELYEHDPTAMKRRKFKKKLEDWFSQRALFCFSQSEKRCQLLAEENGIDRDKVLVVYNSDIGTELLPEKNNYLRDKFKIKKEQYIILAVGSLIFEHCIDQIIMSVDEWPDNCVLVLHGWFGPPEDERFLRHQIELRTGKVFLSTDLLDKKYTVFQSADVGLVFFQPTHKYYQKNFIFAAGSSGKMFDFMRTGVPIIANDIPGMREMVENRKCGMVVKNPKDIGRILPKILEEYELLRKKALESYGFYEFGQCYSHVLKRILSKLEN